MPAILLHPRASVKYQELTPFTRVDPFHSARRLTERVGLAQTETVAEKIEPAESVKPVEKIAPAVTVTETPGQKLRRHIERQRQQQQRRSRGVGI